MTKPEKKSIADLLGGKTASRKPSSEEIDHITHQIHAGKKAAAPKEKSKKISLIAPVTLYLKAKSKATLQDQTLMGYILELIEKDAKTQTLH